MTQAYNQIGIRYQWEGGECPVDGDKIVKVWFDSDDQAIGKADNWIWEYVGPGCTILAFEIM